MDYQQSLKNFNELKNLMRPWAECKIFFFFTSESEYEVEIYDIEYTEKQKNKIDENLIKPTPYGYLRLDKNGHEILYYHDANVTIRYDLFTEDLRDFYCQDPVDINLVRKQFLQLIYIMKNE